jgi:hypothetical protein
MENVVDSKQTPLPAPTILAMIVGQHDLGGVPEKAALVALAHEASLPDVDLVQVGNTVFMGHRGVEGDKNKMVGRSFNVDTARNYISNYVKYLKVIEGKGVTNYSIDFDGEALVPVANAIGKKLQGAGVEAYMAAFEDDSGYRVFFKFSSNIKAE